MALRNQPYLPLYVQDYLTDEKLNMCSAATQGVYIKILCIMHKSDEYGKILLKQKDKQNGKQIENFASKLARLLPFETDIILDALYELIDEKVVYIEGDSLCQKRMIKDEKLSFIRSNAGSLGGKKTQGFAKANAQAKSQANSEYESEYVNEYDNKELIKVWISTFGRNPNLLEQEETEKHFKEFGVDKTKRIYKEAYKKGFRNIFKLTEQLNPDGSIKPKDGETPKPYYNRNPLAGIGK